MGNSRITKNSQFYQQEVWQSSGTKLTEFNGKPNICYLVSSKLQTQYVGLEYIIQHLEQNTQSCEQMMMYQLRQCMNHRNVIGIYNFNKGKSIYRFSNKQIDSNKSIFRVITQYIQIRVCDMKLLNAKQAVQLFKGAAFGVWQIVKHLGGFTITSQMIGIDNKGNVKVWINSNYAQNTVQFQINQNYGQRQMCLQLFKIFDQSICNNEILPNRAQFLGIQTLSQLINFLFELTECETNKELLLQLVLKQNTFKNIQQISKNPNKIISHDNIQSVQNYYQRKKIKPSRSKAQLNSSENQMSKVYLHQENSCSGNENFQRDMYYMHSYPDKPIYCKQTNALSICNSQSSPRFYKSHYVPPSYVHEPKIQSFYSEQNSQSKSNYSNNKSYCISKHSKMSSSKIPQKAIKKNYSTTNFQKVINIPNIQVTQEQFKKNIKHCQSQLINKNFGNKGNIQQAENINTADSPTMKLKMRQEKESNYDNFNGKKYVTLPFQGNFIKKKKMGSNNKSVEVKHQKIIKNKCSLAQSSQAGPIQAKKSFMSEQKNMSLSNQNSSLRINALNSSVNYSEIKAKSLKSKQQSREQQNRQSMVQVDSSKILKKEQEKPNNSNLFDSKNYSKKSFSSIAQEYGKNYSQIELEYLKNFLSQPSSESKIYKNQNIPNQSQQHKYESESQKNQSQYLKLSLGSQSISNNSSGPILQKLHFSKQKKGIIPKIGHRSTFCLQNENEQDYRTRCRNVEEQDNFQFRKQDNNNDYYRQEKNDRDIIQEKSILIEQGQFTTVIYNPSPTHSFNGVLWQSCNLGMENGNGNFYEPFGASCLKTIKQTQREKDLSSYYGQHSDGRQFIKDPLTGSDHCSRKIQRIP